MAYLEDTRDAKEERCSDSLFAILDREFQKVPTERALQRMNMFHGFPRRPDEHIRAFWVRFRKQVSDTRGFGMEITDKAIFAKALQAPPFPKHAGCPSYPD